MSYVEAGYSIVLAILFVYAVWLAVRRRRLTAMAARVAGVTRVAGPAPTTGPAGDHDATGTAAPPVTTSAEGPS